MARLAQIAGADVIAERIGQGGRVAGATRPEPASEPCAADDYPGDYVGLPELSYNPRPGKTAEGGEVVWAWVPYEEDSTQGKDRPVLIIGYDGAWLLGLPLSSVDHEADAYQEAREGRYWVELGSGEWDSLGRSSHVRVDRIVRLDPTTMRRIGGTVTRDVFADVAIGLRRHWAD